MSVLNVVFFFNDTATTEIYTYLHTLSLHDALPIYRQHLLGICRVVRQWRHLDHLEFGFQAARSLHGLQNGNQIAWGCAQSRSEEHTSELQSLMRISYAVFCLKKKKGPSLPYCSRNK